MSKNSSSMILGHQAENFQPVGGMGQAMLLKQQSSCQEKNFEENCAFLKKMSIFFIFPKQSAKNDSVIGIRFSAMLSKLLST